MFIRSLSARNFRSWETVDLTLRPGITIFSGPNGHGKTNLVEAVGYLAHLRSHRVSSDAFLVREGHDKALISATAVNMGRELTATVQLGAHSANRAQVNRTACKSVREISGIVKTVLFAPEDLALVRGEPAGRRRLLDDVVESQYPRWIGIRTDYEKIVRQRNALLKSAGGALRRGYHRDSSASSSAMETLDAWDSQLAATGAPLMARRLALIAQLQPLMTEAYAVIAPPSRKATIEYSTALRPAMNEVALDDAIAAGDIDGATELIEALLLQRLAHRRTVDIERATTTVGPHRDDLDILLGGQSARAYASHGESWSCALALRLATLNWYRSFGSDPILILDDVFAELDVHRREALVGIAHDVEQVLVTAAVGDDLPQSLKTAGVRMVAVEAEDRDDERVSEIIDDHVIDDQVVGNQATDDQEMEQPDSTKED